MNKILDYDLCKCVNLAFFSNIYSSVDDNGTFHLQKCFTGLTSNVIAAFLNPLCDFQ